MTVLCISLPVGYGFPSLIGDYPVLAESRERGSLAA